LIVGYQNAHAYFAEVFMPQTVLVSAAKIWCYARFAGEFMCRNIRTLSNFQPSATQEEVIASALQFVRKVSGFNKPSKANEESFNRAVEQVSAAVHELLHSIVTQVPPRDRQVEAAKARARSQQRFGHVHPHSHSHSHAGADHAHPVGNVVH